MRSVQFHKTRSNVIVPFDRHDEDPAISNVTGSGFFHYNFHDIFDTIVVDNHFDEHLGQQ